MERKDIIQQVKQAAIDVMQDRRVLASVLIAESILISENYSEITGNNPLRMKNLRTERFLIFNTIEECFNYFIDNGIIENGRRNIIGNNNYKLLVKSLRLDNTTENSLIEIIQSYKLYEIDEKVISDMYDGRRTVVEIDNEPFMDFYRVREAYGSDKKEIFSSFSKEEAIKECNKYYGYSVFNSRGKCVYTNALTPEAKAKIEFEKKISTGPKFGEKVQLNNVNLYENPDSKTPCRCITGEYYICDSKRYNNRFAITNKIDDSGFFITGYINEIDKK